MTISQSIRGAMAATLIAILAGSAMALAEPPSAKSPAPQSPTTAWFSEHLRMVEQATVLYNRCAQYANAIRQQKPPPDYYERDALADRTHNQAVSMKNPLYKGMPSRKVSPAHQKYANFLAQSEATLKECGTDLSFYTQRMPAQLQSIDDALEKSEGKISPKEGQGIGNTLEAHDTAQVAFIKAIAGLSNDSHLEGELHAAIMHVMQVTAPPAPIRN